MKPPVGYFGGKTSIARQIATLLPEHEHYVEPFGGSLAVLMAKPRSAMETVNDLEHDLMTFWRVLREQPAELERRCALTPHSRAELQAAYDPASSDIETARRVFVRLTQGRGNHIAAGRRAGWRHHQDARRREGGMPARLASFVARIAPAAERLADVSLECLPALDLIAGYGKHATTLLYVDPPYLGLVRQDCRQDYGHDMRSPADHRELAEALTAAAAAVVVSGYHSDLYGELYDGWHQAEITTHAGNARRPERTEVLWSNRPFPHRQSTFDELAAASP
jgi:DNA adenine methylase